MAETALGEPSLPASAAGTKEDTALTDRTVRNAAIEQHGVAALSRAPLTSGGPSEDPSLAPNADTNVTNQALPPARTLRVLSLDGGGVKGYTTLLILQRIFRTLKNIAGLDDGLVLRPCDVFDLIVGTSTGGIIATMLGRLEMSIDDALEQYEAVGKRVFGKKPFGGPFGKLAKGLTSRPFFAIEDLQKAIKDLLKEMKVDEETMLYVNKKPSCRVMLCVTNKQTSKPDVLRNYLTTHPTQENYKCTIWEGVSATAAAPIYFKRVKFKDQTEWVDGGYAPNRNNPVHEAMAELSREQAFENKDIGCLLSIGTGVPSINAVSDNLLPFLRKSVDMLNDSEGIANEFEKSERGKKLEASNQYFRFSVPQGMQDLNLDDYRETAKMKALTDLYLQSVGTGRGVQQCAQILFKPDENMQLASLTQASLLPNHNVLHFVDRPFYLERLTAFYEQTSQQQMRFVLHGMGGVGKTQLALRFAHECEDKTKVFWIRAESFSNFAKDFVVIYSKLDPQSGNAASLLNQDVLLLRTKELMEQTAGSWLLILDNADNLDEFTWSQENTAGIDVYLPKSGRILLTTRDPRFEGVFAPVNNSLRVDVMNDSEARVLLIKSTPAHLLEGSTRGTIEELIEELGNLPLGVAQAAVNIRDLNLTLGDYIDLFRKKRQRMDLFYISFQDSQTIDVRNRVQSVLVTWEISFQFLEENHPQSMMILRYCSMLHWRNIPCLIIQLLPDFRGMTYVRFRSLVARLLHSSLVSTTQHATGYIELNMHPLVHERISQRLSGEESKAYLTSVVGVLAIAFPYHLSGQSIGQSGGNFMTKDRVTSRLLLPHATSVIEKLGEIDLNIRPAARLMQVVSGHLSDSGRKEVAATMSERALRTAQLAFPPLDCSVHYIRKQFIGCLLEADRSEVALPQIELALQTIDSSDFIDQHTEAEYESEVSTVRYFQLMSLYRAKDSEFMNTVEFLSKQVRSPGSLWHLLPLHNFANGLKRRRDYLLALTISERCLEIYSELDFGSLETQHKWVFTFVLNLTARLFISCLPPESDEDRKQSTYRSAMKLELRSFRESLILGSAANRETWVAANNVSSTARLMGDIDIGLSILDEIITGTLNLFTLTAIEDDFLETMGYTLQELFQYAVLPHVVRRNRAREHINELFRSLSQILTPLGLAILDVIDDPSLMNSVAVAMIVTGDPVRGGNLCYRAISVDPERLYLCDKETWNLLHYNVMISLARQPLKIGDSIEFRNEHQEAIKEPEKEYGTLETRLAGFERQKLLYETAKTMRDEGMLKYQDTWWNEHASDLVKAELFYDVLFEED